MARVTVEDCIEKVHNRFELVVLASYRSREIANGAQMRVEKKRDKNPVVALREIATENIAVENLRLGVVDKMQRYTKSDDIKENEDGDDDLDLDITMDPDFRQKMQSLQKEDSALVKMQHVPMFEDVDLDKIED